MGRPANQNMLNYFVELRQEWIFEALRTYGFVGYRHLMRKFGISKNQAVHDMRLFIEVNGDEIDLRKDQVSGNFFLNSPNLNLEPLIRGKSGGVPPVNGHSGRLRAEAVARASAEAAVRNRAARRAEARKIIERRESERRRRARRRAEAREAKRLAEEEQKKGGRL